MRLSHVVHAMAVMTVAGTCGAIAADAPRALDRPPTNARYALGQTVRELNVDAVPLSRVMDFLRDSSATNIVVNWKVLEAAGVARDTPVSLQVRDLTLRKMLQLVLDQVSPAAQLTYSTDANVLEITTQEEADKKMITKVYVVDDLVMTDNSANMKPPTFNLSDITTSGTTAGGGGGGASGGGGSLFTQNSTDSNSSGDTTEKRGQDLVTLVREIVRPTIWKEAGGTASIRYFSGKLIVTAPVSVHEAIGGPVADEAQRFGM
jgi:type II secretory pathway component HofQ